MSAINVRTLDNKELRKWNRIIASFTDHRVFHTKEWIRYLESFSKAQPLFIVFEQDDKIVGALPGLLYKFPLFNCFMSPMEGWQTMSMGPIFDATKTPCQEIVDAMLRFLKGHYDVKYIEISSRHLEHQIMIDNGFNGSPIYTQRSELTPENEQATFMSIKSKTRNQIRKAIKNSLIVEENKFEGFAEVFYRQLEKVFIRKGSTVPFSLDRVHSLIANMKESGKLLTLSVIMPDKPQCIATGVFLINNNELYLWGWAHEKKYGSLCPIEILTWNAMQKAMTAGCTVFDMAGGGTAKAKYGSKPDEDTTRWVWCKYNALLWVRKKAVKFYRWQQAMRGSFLAKTRT